MDTRWIWTWILVCIHGYFRGWIVGLAIDMDLVHLDPRPAAILPPGRRSAVGRSQHRRLWLAALPSAPRSTVAGPSTGASTSPPSAPLAAPRPPHRSVGGPSQRLPPHPPQRQRRLHLAVVPPSWARSTTADPSQRIRPGLAASPLDSSEAMVVGWGKEAHDSLSLSGGDKVE
ncbi:hypothetical protein BRADI_2g27395v3 [Brachypodium distachyon]|uniref:Uncharacterized protein n=1 Tax=Brachypodium distachyon TaxID=15368 RepID=A0A0Q3J1S9_BRADI|nr:hypothetical protein BRADI_2g27395v3 [Brachypodium distachyon]